MIQRQATTLKKCFPVHLEAKNVFGSSFSFSLKVSQGECGGGGRLMVKNHIKSNDKLLDLTADLFQTHQKKKIYFSTANICYGSI